MIIAFLFVVALGVPRRSTVIIGLVFTPLIARTVRAAVLVERHMDYVPAARLLGEKPARVMFAEILPNVMPAILVEFTVRLGYAVFAVATLSFLGFGIPPPTPDWGAASRPTTAAWRPATGGRSLFPALAIASLVTAVILIADAIEQVLGVMTTDSPPDRAARAARRRPDRSALAFSVANMDVTYRVRAGTGSRCGTCRSSIGRGESYGLVGESGSGKSTVALALVRYLPSNGRVSAGTISINGQDPLSMGNAALRDLRARTVSMVYQEPDGR